MFLLLLLVTSFSQCTDNLVARYDFNVGWESLEDCAGAQPLVDSSIIGCGESQPIVEDPFGEQGMVLQVTSGRGFYIPDITSLIPSGGSSEYSIRIVMNLEQTTGWRRVLNVNHGSDVGLYVNGGVNIYPDGRGTEGTQSDFPANTWVSMTITTGPDGVTHSYINGVLDATWNPLNNWGNSMQILSSTMVFFNDNGMDSCHSGGEHTAAYVKEIQLFNTRLDPMDVLAAETKVWCQNGLLFNFDFSTSSLEADEVCGDIVPTLVDIQQETCPDQPVQDFVEDAEEGTVWHVTEGEGFYIQNIANHMATGADTEYTVDMRIKLERVTSWNRILNTNFGQDTGFYINGGLYYYPDGRGDSQDLEANVWYDITIATDSTGAIYGYVNGRPDLVLSPAASWGNGMQIVSDHFAFFNDVGATSCTSGGEHTNVWISYLAIYDKALTPDEIGTMYGTRLFQNCEADLDIVDIASVDVSGSTMVDGDTVTITLTYPGYMDLLAAEFLEPVGEQTLSLDDIDVTITDGCETDNVATYTTTWTTMQGVATVNQVEGNTVVNVAFTLEYRSQSSSSERVEVVEVGKNVAFSFAAPRRAVLDLSLSLEFGSQYILDVISYSSTAASEVVVEFKTWSPTALVFTGAYTLETDYFNAGSSSLTMNSESDYTHSESGAGKIQTWSLILAEPGDCQTGTHNQTVHVDMVTPAATERIELVLQMDDTYRQECGMTLGEFDLTSTLELSQDGATYVDATSEAAGAYNFYLDQVVYIRATFDSVVTPTSTEIASMDAYVDGVLACSDCVERLEFECASCDSGTASTASNTYEFSVALPGSVFTPTLDGSTVNLEMTFDLGYARRQLASASATRIPLKFMLKDYDCHEPRGLLADTVEKSCDGGVQTMVCGRSRSWTAVTECGAKQPGAVTLPTFHPIMIASVAVAVCLLGALGFGIASKFAVMSQKSYVKVDTAETTV